MGDNRTSKIGTRCVFLPLSSYVDVPRAIRTEVFGWTHRPDEMAVVPWSGHETQAEEVEGVEIVDLVVQNSADWIVSGFLIDGALRHTDPSVVEAFAARLRQDVEVRGPLRVPRHGQVGLAGVVYAGRRSSAKFYGCALGRIADARCTRGSARVTLPVDSKGWRARRGTSVSLTHHVVGSPVLVRSIDIRDPHDWIVNDLRIDGRSQLLYPGDLPSEALQAPERLGMHLDVARREVEILASCDCDQEVGSEFRGSIVGCLLDN